MLHVKLNSCNKTSFFPSLLYNCWFGFHGTRPTSANVVGTSVMNSQASNEHCAFYKMRPNPPSSTASPHTSSLLLVGRARNLLISCRCQRKAPDRMYCPTSFITPGNARGLILQNLVRTSSTVGPKYRQCSVVHLHNMFVFCSVGTFIVCVCVSWYICRETMASSHWPCPNGKITQHHPSVQILGYNFVIN
jgi:hypothetical protein